MNVKVGNAFLEPPGDTEVLRGVVVPVQVQTRNIEAAIFFPCCADVPNAKDTGFPTGQSPWPSPQAMPTILGSHSSQSKKHQSKVGSSSQK